jgi:type II restriction enzyme
MKKDFKEFISQLKETNSTLGSFVDYEKIQDYVDKISIKLNQLNYLIGREDLKGSVDKLFKENPSTFNILEILIAVREGQKKYVLDNSGKLVSLKSYYNTSDQVYTFLTETGLKEIFHNKKITNLVDYVFGIEVGLDTNARKNRGGRVMEKTISNIFENNKIPFLKEVKHTNFKSLTSLGEDVKRFDFVIETKTKTYLIETNFYNDGGSKLNEVARAYSDISLKINKYPEFEFVWITDGKGWLSAKNKLQEAYSIIPSVYNLTTLKHFLEKVKNEGFDK